MRKSLLAVISTGALLLSLSAIAQDRDRDWDRSQIRHVLLVSIDGMHAVDFLNCTHGIAGVNDGAPYCPNLAALGTTGVNYVNASTSKPSDSFPGLMTLGERCDSADPGRLLRCLLRPFAGRTDDRNRQRKSGRDRARRVRRRPAHEAEYEEGLDLDQTKLNGGAPGASLIDGGIASLDPKKLDRDPRKWMRAGVSVAICADEHDLRRDSQCGRLRGVVRQAPVLLLGGRTEASAVLDDYYSPEINSNVCRCRDVTTASGLSCATVPDAGSDLTAWTNSFQNIQCYDTLKVNAILHEIDGKDHLGTKKTHTPTVFGMNFQAVSVGQKLIEGSRPRAAIWMGRARRRLHC